jgi:hypothetical protein
MGDVIQARTEDLETRLVDGELVILDLRSQRYLSLNQSGAALWPLMVEGTDRAQLVEALVSAHGVGDDVAQRDIEALLGQLRGADLVHIEADAHAADD